MGTKRKADQIENPTSRPWRKDAKRSKLSSSALEDRDSSAPSSCSVSEDSTLQSSPSASEHTRKTSLSSLRSSVSNDDSGSPTSDSESLTDSDSGEEKIVTIGGPKKPHMAHSGMIEGAQDLRSRLDALLPQLASSNQLLTSSETGISMEDVEEGEQHIEMNLGLGVLEERNSDESSSSSGDSDATDSDECGNEVEQDSSFAAKRAGGGYQSNVMEKLLGQSSRQRKPGIEDIG